MNKLGFGFLHLPELQDGSIDLDLLCEMVDAYMESGRNYFDTAYTYLRGKSELAIREAVVKRYPRDAFRLCTKLPGYKVKEKKDCYTFFEKQQNSCGVDYFDVYMLHWLNKQHYEIAEKTGQFEFLKELKASGKAKAIGFSFHDTAELLDQILTAHPEVDYVLIQLNYVDWKSESIQSERCYEVIKKHGRKAMVMEPLKGGMLFDPPANVKQMLSKIDGTATPASLALRFAETLEHVEIVLSGMSALQQITENVCPRDTLQPDAWDAMLKAAEMINGSTKVQCSGCGYCLQGCPKQICIPQYFRLYNDISRSPAEGWKIQPAYDGLAQRYGRASECIECRQCEEHCPQQLPITEHLKAVAETFDGRARG